MYNSISTRDVQLIFFLTIAVLKRTSGVHSRFRCLSSSLRSSLLHVCYLHADSLLHPTILCSHYEHNLPNPANDLRELLWLILEENSFKFNERLFIQTHGIAMGTNTPVALSWQT